MKYILFLAAILASPAIAQVDQAIRDRIMSADPQAVQELYVDALRSMGCSLDNNDVDSRVAFGDLLIDGVFDLVDMPNAHRNDRDVRNTALMPTDDAAFALINSGRVNFDSNTSVFSLPDC